MKGLTGQAGTFVLLLENARKLGIDLSEVEEVILSHNHHDHVGGL
jgi:7,8-dihydropterin-6-yl-methyl-4-(beta-D-ribofuranosyl)aminobenzene 5'-phosphate synthase